MSIVKAAAADHYVWPQMRFQMITTVWIGQTPHIYHSSLREGPIDFRAQKVKDQGHR